MSGSRTARGCPSAASKLVAHPPTCPSLCCAVLINAPSISRSFSEIPTLPEIHPMPHHVPAMRKLNPPAPNRHTGPAQALPPSCTPRIAPSPGFLHAAPIHGRAPPATVLPKLLAYPARCCYVVNKQTTLPRHAGARCMFTSPHLNHQRRSRLSRETKRALGRAKWVKGCARRGLGGS